MVESLSCQFVAIQLAKIIEDGICLGRWERHGRVSPFYGMYRVNVLLATTLVSY